MTWLDWVPAVSVTSAVGVALALFGKDFIAKLVEGAAKHSFDRRLEDFKAELRKDEERLKAELRDHEKHWIACGMGPYGGSQIRTHAWKRAGCRRLRQYGRALSI